MAPQVKDFEEFLAQAMTSSATTTISASPSLESSSLYSNGPSSPSSSDPSPSPSNDQELDQLEQQHRNDDSFYDNLSFETPPQTTPSSQSHAIYLNPHSQELSPMQLVNLSNLKLNNEMFSNRSLSIQKRIQVKNLLTMLYTLHPPYPQEWHYQIQIEEQQQEEQGQPDKTYNGQQWTTLDAAGLQAGERSSSLQGVPPSPSLTPSQPSSNNPFLIINSNTSSSSPSTSSLEPPGSSKATKVPLPRPKSTDLPQSLHSYLSTVFDVDWSVGLSTTEDSLFTLHGAGSSSSGPGSSSSSMSGPGAPLSSSPKRKSLSASSSLSLSLSLSDFITPSGSGNSTHANGSTNGGTRSSTASTSSSTSSFSTSSSSTVSSISNVSAGNSGTSSTPLVRKSSLPSSQPKNINVPNRGPTNNITNTNSGNNNSTTGGENVVRKQSVASKPMMVPGRRSSLLQTGQMPTAVNTLSSSGSLSPGIGRNNSYTTPKSPTLSGSPSPTLSPYSHAPSSPSLSPTLSPASSGSFSFGNGVAPPSPSLSPTLSPTLGNKPAISRRTSSLPTERPRQNQRLPSSENGTPTLSSLGSPASGLPRPLQTSTMSSLSSSPPSPSTLAPSGPKHLQAPYPYSRSVSDEQINFSSYQQQQYTRHGASSSSPSSPSYAPLPPISSSYSGVPAGATSLSTSLAKPLPSYTLNKASKSSPNLGDGANGPNYYGDNHPPLPLSVDLQYQQQFQQQFFQRSPPSSPSTTGASGEQQKSSTSSGFNKLLSRTSSRRGAVGNTTPESYANGQSGATSIGAAMTISAPLSLISSVDQESFQSNHQYHHQYHYQPQSQSQAYKAQDSLSSSPRSYGHGYSQSVSGHSFSSASHGSQPSSTTASASSGGGGGGGGNRWSSMKTMLGLRVGQTKG